MRILIISINYSPELTGIGKYTGEMAEWLDSAGHKVDIITAPPYYPEWKVKSGYSRWRYKREKHGNISVTRCPLWVPKQPTGLTRILHLVSFAFFAYPAMLWKAIRYRPDIVFVLMPTFFCAPGALMSARLVGAKAWLHIQDFEIDAAFDLGIIKNQFIRRHFLSFESWVMRRFNRVSAISYKMVEKLEHKGVEKDRCTLFQNWSDTDSIAPLRHDSVLRDRLNVTDNTTIILYAGNIGEKQGLEIIIEAAMKLEDSTDLLFIISGDGCARKRLQLIAKNLNNIKFCPLQPLDKLNELLNIADIHLLPQRADAADLVMPSKLTNMMASGRPVITTAHVDTQVAKIVSQCGIVVPTDDLEAFIGAIQLLASDPCLRQKLGTKGRQYAVEHWSRDHILYKVFSKIELSRLLVSGK